MKQPIVWTKYPLRVCRWSNHCRLCDRTIVMGDEYYDGGHGRRAHKACVDNLAKEETEK